MKVLLIGFTKISYMPYMYFYLDQLKKNNCEVHLLYWDRDGKVDANIPEGVKTYCFTEFLEDSLPLKNKIFTFLKYRKFAAKIIKGQEFDLLLVMHSTPGIVLFDILTRRYKEKYILDYRDFTYENKKFYRNLIHKLINNSVASFVSSDGYRKYLPNISKLHTSHNLIIDSVKYRKINKSKKSINMNPIKIRYWGLMRHEDINIKIIEKLANDDRFELHYHGREQATGHILKKYCQENQINNIFFHGEYQPKERYEFVNNTDILHNIYENDIKTINAMGNKYYDGVNFYIPQLCNKNSFMGNHVEKYNIGVALNPESPYFAEEIFNYYNSLNWSDFEKSCDKTLNKILMEYYEGVKKIENIVNEEKNN